MQNSTERKASVLKIDGVKFHQAHLYRLRFYERESKLHPSEIAMFLISLYYCNDFGIINMKESLVREGEKRTNIPYQTLYTAFNGLKEKKLITEEIHNNRSVYVISDYAAFNSTEDVSPIIKANPMYQLSKAEKKAEEEKSIEKGNFKPIKLNLNYFYLPTHLLDEDSHVLKKLVSSKDTKGLLALLDLLNAHARDFNKKIPLERKMDYLKKALNRSASKVCIWLDKISALFAPVMKVVQMKQPKENMQRNKQKKNNPTQKVIGKVRFILSEKCFYNQEDPHKVQQRAAVRKDILAQTKNWDFCRITSQDVKDMVYTYDSLVLTPLYSSAIVDEKRRKKCISILLNTTIVEIKNTYSNKKDKINSVGAIFRTFLKPILIEFFKNDLMENERSFLLREIFYNKDYYKAIHNLLIEHDFAIN